MVKKRDNYTINDLATAVAKGFEEINDKFDKRFDAVDKRFDQMDKKIETEVGSLRSEMRAEFRNIEKRIDVLEVKIDQMEKTNNDEILILSGDLIELKSRVHRLEQKIAKLKLAS